MLLHNNGPDMQFVMSGKQDVTESVTSMKPRPDGKVVLQQTSFSRPSYSMNEFFI